jgi:eukaryotic-like serine/threonine-protein kinase
MGIVLKVTHLHLEEELAVKVLLPEGAINPDMIARFLREAQSAVRLRGEHVARVIDVGVLPEGLPFIVMEYLRGVDLAGELHRRTMLPPGEAVDYVLQVCEALAEAHAHNIVHRDIKPANLFLTTRPDGTPLVKVLDFGISKAPITSGPVTRTDIVMGTAGYMSPEQMKASKDVDARTDIWALGIVLYEFLSGRRPFVGDSFSAVVLMAGTDPPPPMDPRIHRALQGVVLRCLEKDRRARFSSVAELAAALAPFAHNQRAAATIVERTFLMSRGSNSGMVFPDHSAEALVSTTLSGSAGVAQPRTKRRHYTAIGVIALVGSLVGIFVASQIGQPKDDRVVAPFGFANTRSPDAPTLGTSVGPSTVDRTGVEKAERISKCTELQTQQVWQALDDCATALEVLGVMDKAKEFHAKAAQEAANEGRATKIKQALRDSNLKVADTLLQAVNPDSVYLPSLHDAFIKTEAQAAEEATHKAKNLADVHDCAALKRYLTQLAATMTDRVAAAVKAVSCSDKTRPVEPTASKATPLVKTQCATMDIYDMMQQAEHQYSAGYAKAALAVVSKALVCAQNVRMYRTAAMYACSAHDLVSAKLYFNKLPEQDQYGIEQRCHLSGLNLHGQ